MTSGEWGEGDRDGVKEIGSQERHFRQKECLCEGPWSRLVSVAEGSPPGQSPETSNVGDHSSLAGSSDRPVQASPALPPSRLGFPPNQKVSDGLKQFRHFAQVRGVVDRGAEMRAQGLISLVGVGRGGFRDGLWNVFLVSPAASSTQRLLHPSACIEHACLAKPGLHS